MSTHKAHIPYKKGFCRLLTLSTLLMGGALVAYAPAFADTNLLPSGGQVKGGSASFDYSSPNQLHIHQSSDRAVINWDSFNIGPNALTQFHQNSSSAIAVNRVTGAGLNPTQILGSLKANGKVVVLDRNGVIFGPNSRIDVGGMIASTGDIDDTAFMAGASKLGIFSASDAAIVMNGEINVLEAGLAAFVAPHIVNNGIITAKLGRITLASGTKATVDLYGDGLVELATDMPTSSGSISQKGQLKAEGGTIHLTAHAARNIVDHVINMDGITDVSSVTQKGGKIILEGASTRISGVLDASGKTGGGTIYAGGEYLGGGTTRHADTIFIEDTALLKANTTGAEGDGGKVIVWSDEQTVFAGRIEANAGSASGDGGFIETSSKENLNVKAGAGVMAAAANGQNGEWLLDPRNVILRDAAGTNVSAGGTHTASSDNQVVDVKTIEAALNNGLNVTIYTGATGNGAQNGDITLEDSINKTAGGNSTLTLRAHSDIFFNNNDGDADLPDIISTSGALNILLNSRYGGGLGGISLSGGGTINTNGGWFIAGGGSGALWGADGLRGTADDAASTGPEKIASIGNDGHGIILLNYDLHTGTGDIIMNGASGGSSSGSYSYGVQVTSGSNITSTSGSIRLNGTGKAGEDGLSGIVVNGSGTSIETNSGAITLTGTGGTNGSATSGENTGIILAGAARIISHGAGTIALNGTGANGGDSSNHGIEISNAQVLSAGGTIAIDGQGRSAGSSGVRITAGSLIGSTGNSVADINMTGIRGSGGTDIATSGGSNIFGGTGGYTGNVTLNGEAFSLANLNVQTTGKGILKTRTSQSMGLSGGSGTVALNDTTLSAFNNVGTFVIGDSSGTILGDIDVDTWNMGARNYAVELYGNDITLRGLTLGSGAFKAHAMDMGADPGDLTVSAPVTKSVSGVSDLFLQADHNIVFGNGNITASTGSLNVILNADRDADQAGRIQVSSSNFTTNGGNIVMGGGAGQLGGANGILGDGDGTGADDTAAWGIGIDAAIALENANFNLGGGSLYAYGAGWQDVFCGNTCYGLTMVNGTSVTTTGNGSINMKGQGGGTSSGYSLHGLTAINTVNLQTQNGDINLQGSSNGTIFSMDLSFGNGLTFTTTGTGNINLISPNAMESWGYTTLTSGNDISIRTNGFQSQYFLMSAADSILFRPYTASTSLSIGAVQSGMWSFDDTLLAALAANTIIFGDAINGTGDVSIGTWDLSGNASNAQLHGRDIAVNGLTTGTGDVTLYSKRNVTVAGTNVSASSGDLNILGMGNVAIDTALTNSGTGKFNIFAGWDGSSALTTSALFDLDDVALGSTARNIVLGSGASLSSGSTGTSVLLAASGDFENNAVAGAGAIVTPSGRYLVYSSNPTDTLKNGLTAKSLYNQTYTSAPSSSLSGDSRFIYAYQPTLTLTPDNISAANPGSAVFTYSVSGLINGDAQSDALSGMPAYTLGTPSGFTYPVIIAAGTTTSPLGYALSYSSSPATLTLPYMPALSASAPPLPLKGLDGQIAVTLPLTETVASDKKLSEVVADDLSDYRQKQSGGCLAAAPDGQCIVR